MDSSFGVLDAFAFVVFAVLILVGVVIVVSLGKLPGQLAHKWKHPQAGAINAALCAAAILGNKHPAIAAALDAFREQQTASVLSKPDPRTPSRI